MNPLKLELLKMRHARHLAMSIMLHPAQGINCANALEECMTIEADIEAAIAAESVTKLPVATGSTAPARRHVAQEPELSLTDNMPTAAAQDFQSVQNRINNIFPSWKKHPHFTRAEQEELMANRKTFFTLTARDWSMLENYYQSDIPVAWMLRTWRPESRSKFVQAISDIVVNAEAWVKECKIRGVASGVEGSDK
jgi:hypothetical protein